MFITTTLHTAVDVGGWLACMSSTAKYVVVVVVDMFGKTRFHNCWMAVSNCMCVCCTAHVDDMNCINV